MASPRTSSAALSLSAMEKESLTMTKRQFSTHVKTLLAHFKALWKARARVSHGMEAVLPGNRTVDQRELKYLKGLFEKELKQLRKIHSYGRRKTKTINGVEIPVAKSQRKSKVRTLNGDSATLVAALAARYPQMGITASAQGVTSRDNLVKIIFAWGAMPENHRILKIPTGGMTKPDKNGVSKARVRQEVLFDLTRLPTQTWAQYAQIVSPTVAKQFSPSAVPMYYLTKVLSLAFNPLSEADQVYAANIDQEFRVLKGQADLRAAASKEQSKATAKAKRAAEKAAKLMVR